GEEAEPGDTVFVYCEGFPPEEATVATVASRQIRVVYGDGVKPNSEWLPANQCDLLRREG
ncbi:MAG: hypothetical protein JZU65_12935, partial [Chlorobium sp.]|nr:hypothetical protein [Chlorobium sp.]